MSPTDSLSVPNESSSDTQPMSDEPAFSNTLFSFEGSPSSYESQQRLEQSALSDQPLSTSTRVHSRVDRGYAEVPDCLCVSHGKDGSVHRQRQTEHVALEVPMALSFNGIYFTVLSCTPADLEDLAVGAAFSSGVITSIDDVVAIHVDRLRESCAVDITLQKGLSPKASSLRKSSVSGFSRSMVTFNLPSYYPAHMAHVRECEPIPYQAIWAASRGLDQRQKVRSYTGATHAAAFVDRKGNFLALREDVGRHNALDKLIGCLLKERMDPLSGFVFLSSRCALELVNKAIHFGVSVIATVSAPTSSVIGYADEANVTLCAFARGERFTIYTHPER
ncbi:MAG: formate dehydrogenase accessory sulfurtransferase FdhD, partial [Eggerthellaceae bacterium]|nr:formate dehydrogenase accessory sulfurtransferase FdhD [Eggerthellaceae bacterium]